MSRRPTVPAAAEPDRPAAFHGTRYATATSDRERASATWSQLLAAIRKIRPDSAQNAAYRRLDETLQRLLDQIGH